MRNSPLSKEDKAKIVALFRELDILPKLGKVEIDTDLHGGISSVKIEATLR